MALVEKLSGKSDIAVGVVLRKSGEYFGFCHDELSVVVGGEDVDCPAK